LGIFGLVSDVGPQQQKRRIDHGSRGPQRVPPPAVRKSHEGWLRVQTALVGWLTLAADVLDENVWLCFGLIAICFAPLGILRAHSTLLVNDEIYSVHIAQASNLRSMLALAREIDLHPPLHYLAERLTLAMPAPRWLAARVPSILAGLVVCFALFRYAAKRTSPVFGLVAVAIFWFSPVLDSAWVARPYMLWMAWLCLLLLGRDAAVRPARKAWAVTLVFVLTLLMLMTHLIGIACVGPFLVAEFVRGLSRRRMDWPLVLAFLLPTLVGLGFFYQLHHLSENVFPSSQAPSFKLAGDIYGAIFGNTLLIVAVCAFAVTVIFVPEMAKEFDVSDNRPKRLTFNLQDVALLLALLFLPFLLLIPAAIFHLQFWLRYAFAAMPGLALLGAWLLARRLVLARVVAVLLIAASVGYMVQRMVGESGPQGNAGTMDGGRMPIVLSSLDHSLPIVAASPMTFVEMSDRERPEIARRVFYLTDRDAALRYSHYTLFENEDKIRQLLDLPSQTADLNKFIGEHEAFYVVGNYDEQEVWLLRKLASDGLKLDYLGKFQSTYESNDLYRVSRDDLR
jgi:hypothetical protein